MAASTNVLYSILLRLFCCSKSMHSSQKKPRLESFAIDSEFSDAPAQRHLGHALMGKESNVTLAKEASRRGHHPERVKKLSPKRDSQASLRSQSASAGRKLLIQSSDLGCGRGSELHAKSVLDECESNTRVEDDRYADTKTEKEQDSCARSTVVSQLRMDVEGTADVSEFTGNPEEVGAATNDPSDIISSYKDPSLEKPLGTDAISNTPNRDSIELGWKTDLASMEAFLVSKPYCESSSEDVESETEVSYAVDFHDRKTFNKILSRRMLAFIKFRQNSTRKHP